ncbi:MAG: bifunctional nuclease family protein [Ornithinimicrobium sp.]|uniref:bifunctional nuclease family protein n=1 Tax=Ornithinimicrobium sp. TaxID=1977084 RepID=UPI0026DFC57A|nr:bifunctional nuclease family protein [Ornithinimicrobium sp.]MDO5741104.1 bifunctional nuclease family protein [Ornithinimicrobium sp.]
MKELDVMGVRVEMPTNSPIVLLRERGGQRYVPIWIGAPEATAIAYAQQGVEPPRPLTHDLMASIISELGRKVDTIHITSLEDGIFYAELHFDNGTVISARPSDAIALALRTATQILASEELLDEVGITMAVEEEDEVERFREFLDQVSAEDFEAGPEGPAGEQGASPPAGPDLPGQ